jgi:thymidylate synthase
MVFDMQYPLVTIKPNTSWLYMCAEPMWVIAGSNELNWHPEISNIQEAYSDNHETLSGAYGPAFKHQLAYILRTLNADRNSRQAVMTIWKRNPLLSKDIPCTLALQFIIRNDVLDCIVTMRSSDVGMGLPYDMLTFTCIAAEIASLLSESTELGCCYITAGSRHIYQNHFDKLSYLYSNFVANAKDDYKAWQIWKWPSIKETMYTINAMQYEDRAHAQSIAYDKLLGASG